MQTSFFARVQTLAQSAKAPDLIVSFTPKVETRKRETRAHSVDAVVTEMLDWCNDSHDLPDMSDLLQIEA